MTRQRFTLDGGAELERQLGLTCRRVLSDVQTLLPPHKLEALVLGGGYGRGEGGVLRTEQGERPYNDLEFYVFVRGNRVWNERKYGRALQDLGLRLSPEAGLHVEFKVDSLARMRTCAVSIFSYDLVSAHRVLFGSENVFRNCEHHLRSGAIPVSEASRLLFNRCSGLLLARELLADNTILTKEQSDFVGRNLAKAELCLGDAILAVLGRHHWSCIERARRLKRLPTSQLPQWFEEVRRRHKTGFQFKLHPQQICKTATEFERDCQELRALALQVWLWVENRRLGCNFNSANVYALDPTPKCPEAARLRNYLLNVRAFGVKAAWTPLSWRYPRERLFNALPLLLWNGNTIEEPELVAHLQKQLASKANDWAGFVRAYKQIWPQYG